MIQCIHFRPRQTRRFLHFVGPHEAIILTLLIRLVWEHKCPCTHTSYSSACLRDTSTPPLSHIHHALQWPSRSCLLVTTVSRTFVSSFGQTRYQSRSSTSALHCRWWVDPSLSFYQFQYTISILIFSYFPFWPSRGYRINRTPLEKHPGNVSFDYRRIGVLHRQLWCYPVLRILSWHLVHWPHSL